MRGELKPSQLEKLGKLATICAPISRLDDFITSRNDYKTGTQLFSEVLQETGMGMAPLDSEQAEVRIEQCLCPDKNGDCSWFPAQIDKNRRC